MTNDELDKLTESAGRVVDLLPNLAIAGGNHLIDLGEGGRYSQLNPAALVEQVGEALKEATAIHIALKTEPRKRGRVSTTQEDGEQEPAS